MEDAEAINEMRRQRTVAEWTMGLPSERIAQNREFLQALSPEDHVLVAELDDRVVGMAGLHVRRGKGQHAAALGIMVREEYQGQGIGRRLMDALLDLADNWLGLVRVELDVFAGNDRAIRLYESLGFQREGLKRKDVFRNGRYEDVVVMGRVQ
jgi:putative acetyltransferase